MKRLGILLIMLVCGRGDCATVTSTADDGPGSLRAAISNAAPGETITFSIGTPASDQLPMEEHHRRHHPHPPGLATITLTSGELLIDRDLTIAGPGADGLAIERSAETNTPAFRIFNVQSGSVAIAGVTISNGRELDGAGIHNEAHLTLMDCVITGNAAGRRGGGIENTATLTMSGCSVSSNSAVGSFYGGGGGIFNFGHLTGTACFIESNSVTNSPFSGAEGGGVASLNWLALTNSAIRVNSAVAGAGGNSAGGGMSAQGTLLLDTSTIANNSAVVGNGDGGFGGGGIHVGLCTLLLVRSTVSGNFAGFGGGIESDGSLVVVESSTISGNILSSHNPFILPGGAGILCLQGSETILHQSTITANSNTNGYGGGFFNVDGLVVVGNSIVAGNISAGVDMDNSPLALPYSGPGKTISVGFNLIGTTNGIIRPSPSDQFGTPAEALKIGPLRDNGGPTLTHQLLCGSPAINAGDNTDAPPTDQRGFPRVMGGRIDIGAYEAGNQPGEVVNADGCSIEDLCPCGAGWKNHGEFLTCVERATAEFVAQGLISEAEGGRLISAAARFDCGKRK